jgi:hypothetical protein
MTDNVETIYAFIDSQNLNLGVNSQGWKLDWRKFRQYLRNKYNVSKAYLFIGYKDGNEELYDSLRKKGYLVVCWINNARNSLPSLVERGRVGHLPIKGDDICVVESRKNYS